MHVVCSQETVAAVVSRDDKSMAGGGGGVCVGRLGVGGGGEGAFGCIIKKLTTNFLACSSYVSVILL